MKDRKQSLKDLLERVEEGNHWHFSEFDPSDILPSEWIDAFNGSLDAAKALHEAVMPEYSWHVDDEGNATVEHYGAKPFRPITGEAPNPARAWLIAILKAHIDKEEY